MVIFRSSPQGKGIGSSDYVAMRYGTSTWRCPKPPQALRFHFPSRIASKFRTKSWNLRKHISATPGFVKVDPCNGVASDFGLGVLPRSAIYIKGLWVLASLSRLSVSFAAPECCSVIGNKSTGQNFCPPPELFDRLCFTRALFRDVSCLTTSRIMAATILP